VVEIHHQQFNINGTRNDWIAGLHVHKIVTNGHSVTTSKFQFSYFLKVVAISFLPKPQQKSKILDYSYSRPVIKLKPSLNMKMFTWLDRLGVDLKPGAHYLCKECTSTVRFTFSCKEDESVEVDMVAMATPTA
jgi:hypothetical protein